MFRRFLKDESGFAFVFFLLSLPAFVGIALIVIDIGRVNNLHYDLQKGVDSLALAGAAELDGSLTAITRAEAAMTGLLVNRARFTDGGEITINAATVSWRFLHSLPASDNTPIDTSYETDDPLRAVLVEVTIDPARAYTSIFPVGSASQTLNVGAQAVAGYTSGVCDFMPMFICNPYENEPDGIALEDVLDDPELQRKQIELRQQGGGQSQAFAGNFGFLESPTSTNEGANGLREMFATVKPPACFNGRGVLIKPGFAATVTDAVNVRFDIYFGPMNGNKNNVNYRPARNVRKGYEDAGNECNADPSTVTTDFMPLPRDENFTDIQGGAVGDGNWNFEQYWAVNFDHDTDGHVPIPAPNGWSNGNLPTRHEVYRYEVDNSLTSSTSVGGEDGAPGCYGGGTLNDDPDRRLIYGAILDCEALSDEGKISGSHQEPLPVRAFGSFFLTEALEKGLGSVPGELDNQTFRVELVDLSGPQGNGSLDDFQRNEAVIYR
jgi:Flp pilus assembly protein TadG